MLLYLTSGINLLHLLPPLVLHSREFQLIHYQKITIANRAILNFQIIIIFSGMNKPELIGQPNANTY
jgi:hypothetical protein